MLMFAVKLGNYVRLKLELLFRKTLYNSYTDLKTGCLE
jgi:hypothetical protein